MIWYIFDLLAVLKSNFQYKYNTCISIVRDNGRFPRNICYINWFKICYHHILGSLRFLNC